MVLHLHNTHQETKPITSKVEDLGNQWRDLQDKLRELSEYLGKGKLVCSVGCYCAMHTLHKLHARIYFYTRQHCSTIIFFCVCFCFAFCVLCLCFCLSFVWFVVFPLQNFYYYCIQTIFTFYLKQRGWCLKKRFFTHAIQ